MVAVVVVVAAEAVVQAASAAAPEEVAVAAEEGEAVVVAPEEGEAVVAAPAVWAAGAGPGVAAAAQAAPDLVEPTMIRCSAHRPRWLGAGLRPLRSDDRWYRNADMLRACAIDDIIERFVQPCSCNEISIAFDRAVACDPCIGTAHRVEMIRFFNAGLDYQRLAGERRSPGDADHTGLIDLSFTIESGGFRWLTGASGAGKTTLLKLMYLALPPTSGRIELLDSDPARLDRAGRALLRRRIGVVYQDFRLLNHLSAFDNVALPLRLARRKETQIHADVTELLRWVGLADRLAHRPEELSGGEQQRVAICRAVVGRPSLLLADEPTGNLDDEQAVRLLHLFMSLNQLGTTVIIASHNLSLIERYRAPVLELQHGRLVYHG
ncbi:cell division transport system ATP-binding protein [Acidiphilium sp. MT5]